MIKSFKKIVQKHLGLNYEGGLLLIATFLVVAILILILDFFGIIILIP